MTVGVWYSSSLCVSWRSRGVRDVVTRHALTISCALVCVCTH